MKKQIALALLFAILAQLTACGGGSGDNETTPSDTSDKNPTEESTSLFKEDLPEKDYGGYEFRVLSTNEVGTIRYSNELYAETETGETLNDAVFKRNRAIEDEFGVKIARRDGGQNDVKNMFMQSVMADDDDYDALIDTQQNTLGSAYMYALEIDDLPYIDINDPWWDAEVINSVAIGGKAYALTGDINIVDNNATFCLLYNKRIAEENKIGDLYSLVREGKWTIDAFEKVCKDISRDLNTDGIVNFDDQCAFVASGTIAGAMFFSAGGSFSNMNSDGELEFTIDSEKNVLALTRLNELFGKKDIVLDTNAIIVPEGESTVFTASRRMFREGRVLFLGGMVNYADYFRDMEDEYGFLPNPKYDENQKSYRATTQLWTATMWTAPKNAKDPERTSIILDAMASAGKELILPAYYEDVLPNKSTRDEESMEMLDYIFDGSVIDVANLFNLGEVNNVTGAITSAGNTVASQIATYKDAAQLAYELLLEDIESASQAQ